MLGKEEQEFWRSEASCPGVDLEGPLGQTGDRLVTRVALGEATMGIRLADTPEGRNAAGALIKRMYSWRGYESSGQVPVNPNVTTITAEQEGATIATVTLTIDSEVGLLADATFGDILQKYRGPGRRLAEITKLAVDRLDSREALAALFNILFMYVRSVNPCTDVFIEVNPRHRRYYERSLAFECVAEVRDNPRVNAPAYLLWVSPAKAAKLVEEFRGRRDAAASKLLYSYFFSQKEEEAITARILQGASLT